MREVFKGFSDAWAFAVGKEGAAVRVCNGGWEVTWTGEKVAPDGGCVDVPYTGGKSIKDSFLDVLASKETVDALGRLIASASQPAEIVQRHVVAGLSHTFAAEGKDDACTVSLRAVSGPYNTGEMRHFGVSKEQAMLFRFGSEVEVVLRPAPLA